MTNQPDGQLTVALVHAIFPGPDETGLREHLIEAQRRGAALALLPELPMDRWAPADKTPTDSDAEPPGGPRHQALAAAARSAGIGVAGGAIVIDADSGERRNRMLLFDATGTLMASYDKVHVPNEEGYWEAEHYSHGQTAPDAIAGFGMRVGMQICSDLFRPMGCHLLGARGAEVILAPRATPGVNYQRWCDIIRADAITSSCYVLSVNRPGPQGPADAHSDVSIGGPSIAATPDGRVFVESTDPVTLVILERRAVEQARRDYPGYLAVRSKLYGRAWSATPDGPR